MMKLIEQGYINIKLTYDEFEYMLYEVLEYKLTRSNPSVALDIKFIIKDWREQAKAQCWQEPKNVS